MKNLELTFENLKKQEILKEALKQLMDSGNEFIGWSGTESPACGILNGYYGDYKDCEYNVFNDKLEYVMPISELIDSLE